MSKVRLARKVELAKRFELGNKRRPARLNVDDNDDVDIEEQAVNVIAVDNGTKRLHIMMWVNFVLVGLLIVLFGVHVTSGDRVIAREEVVTKAIPKSVPFNVVTDTWFNLSLKLDINIVHYDVCCRTIARVLLCNKAMDITVVMNDDVRIHIKRPDMLGAMCIFTYS